MSFEEWFKNTSTHPKPSWEEYLDEIITKGYIVDHTDIKVYMKLAYIAGQESVKGDQ